MNVLFLVPPDRRPYELYYFTSSPERVFIGIDEITFKKYKDWFREFHNYGCRFNYVFLRREKRLLSSFFHSTATWDAYSRQDVTRTIKEIGITHVSTVELFSFLSREVCKLLDKLQKRVKFVPIVWENLSKHPFYWLPFYKENFLSSSARSSKIICVTNKSRLHLSYMNIDDKKIKVVYPGIFSQDSSGYYSSKNKDIDILFVGNLNKQKGIHLVLNTTKILIKKSRNLKVGIIGDGAFKNKVRRLQQNHPDNVRYFGEVSHDEIYKIYSRSKVFFLPVLPFRRLGVLLQEEQFGFSIVEAMRAGLTVVTTNVGAVSEIVGKGNFVLKPEVNHFVDALDAVLNDPQFLIKNMERNMNRVNAFFNAKKQSRVFFSELDALSYT